MLWGGARGGHREMCELAKEWGANDFNGMLWYGALHGHREICELAKQWGGVTNFDE